MHINPEIMDLIVKAIFGLLALGGVWLVGYVKNALKEKVEAGQASELDRLIYDFVAAAEQQLKKSDPTGQYRKQYVVDMLTALGIEVNAEINARIEAAVYSINMGEKALK